MRQSGAARGILGLVWVVCGLACGAEGRQAAGAADAVTISAWFQRAWDDAQKFPAFEGVSIAWRIEDWETLPPGELAALKREVAGHPEHPLRGDVPRFERHAAGIPTVMRHTLFSRGEQNWRFNTTFDEGSYNDAVLRDGAAWWMSDEALKVMDPSMAAGMEDPEQSLVTYEREFVSPVGKLLHGYLSVGRTAGMRPGRLQVQGSNWSTRLSAGTEGPAEQRLEMAVNGRWDAAAGRGFVERVTIVASGYKPDTVGRRYEFKGWHRAPELGVYVAERVDEFSPRGVLERSVVFEGFAPMPAGGFAAVTAEPGVGRADVVRGELRARLTNDYRSGAVREYLPGGEVREHEMVEGAWSVRRTMRERLRWAGWLMIGAVAVTGCVIVRGRGGSRN